MVYVDPRLQGKPSPVVSVARMESEHVARFNRLKGSAPAVIDEARKPGLDVDADGNLVVTSEAR